MTRKKTGGWPTVALCALTLAGAVSAAAADFSDPSWPCVQRKVETLSIALMWPYPLGDDAVTGAQAKAVDALADQLVLRRLPLEQVAPTLASFTETHGQDAALMGAVFEESFKRMSRLRRALISGIEDYSLGQIDLAARIDATRAEMARLMEAESPDFDRVDALEEQLDWSERIYTDRQRSLTYVCESPVLIEKRLFAIARLLSEAVAE